MSEFLYRGYNVAVPAVDIGDDVYVVEDRLGTTIEWTKSDAIGWGESFAPYLDRWPAEFPENPDGPGAITGAALSPDL